MPPCRAVAARGAEAACQLEVDEVLVFADCCCFVPHLAVLFFQPKGLGNHPFGAGLHCRLLLFIVALDCSMPVYGAGLAEVEIGGQRIDKDYSDWIYKKAEVKQ